MALDGRLVKGTDRHSRSIFDQTVNEKCCSKVMFNSLRENLRINRSCSDFELYISHSESIYLFFFPPPPYTQLEKHNNAKNHEESKARL